jgi:hypothetical protein
MFAANPVTQIKSLFNKFFSKKTAVAVDTIDPAISTVEPAAPRRKSKLKAIILTLVVILLILGIGGGVVAAYTYQVVIELRGQATTAQNIAQNAYTNFKGQNLPGAEAELKNLSGQLDTIRETYKKLAFYKAIPIANFYYQDGEHGLAAARSGLDAGLKSVEAIAPYADVLGFSGEGTFEGGTAENRVKLMLETLEKVTPQLDSISADLAKAEEELSHIDPNRYPETIKGTPVRARIIEGKSAITNANTLLKDYRPIIEHLPSIAGSTGERRKYLILFQNNGELRATGGFLTAYAVIFIEDGVITPEKSDDIYEIDKKFTKKVPIPLSLGRFLTTEKYWNLRDMNISPDFKTSMEQFYSNYQQVRGEPANIDGIIAVDTHLLTDLIKIVGPIQIEGYGTFSAETDPRCDCPQIIYALSEIITKPTPYIREDRKGILGPLMQSVLKRIYQSPRVFMAQLFQVGLDSMGGRDLQVYFFNEQHQQAAEAINAAGRLKNNATPTKDFFALVNSNLGGAKSYFFIDYEMNQKVEAPADGKIKKTVEITYKNNRRGDNCNLEAGQLCLNATLRDWTRIYVPEGSVLDSSQGFLEEPKVYSEIIDGTSYTVFDGYFKLEPNSQAKLVLNYTVPYDDSTNYSLRVWKQGGIAPFKLVVDVTGGEEEFFVNKDVVYQTQF